MNRIIENTDQIVPYNGKKGKVLVLFYLLSDKSFYIYMYNKYRLTQIGEKCSMCVFVLVKRYLYLEHLAFRGWDALSLKQTWTLSLAHQFRGHRSSSIVYN